MCRNGSGIAGTDFVSTACDTTVKTCSVDPLGGKCSKYKFNKVTQKCELQRTLCPQQPPDACKMVSRLQLLNFSTSVTNKVFKWVDSYLLNGSTSGSGQHLG
jgi:hypothetical protein